MALSANISEIILEQHQRQRQRHHGGVGASMQHQWRSVYISWLAKLAEKPNNESMYGLWLAGGRAWQATLLEYGKPAGILAGRRKSLGYRRGEDAEKA